MGPAWADKAYAADTAHTDVECSNAGYSTAAFAFAANVDANANAANAANAANTTSAPAAALKGTKINTTATPLPPPQAL